MCLLPGTPMRASQRPAGNTVLAREQRLQAGQTGSRLGLPLPVTHSNQLQTAGAKHAAAGEADGASHAVLQQFRLSGAQAAVARQPGMASSAATGKAYSRGELRRVCLTVQERPCASPWRW